MATNARQHPNAYADKTVVPLNIFDQQASSSAAQDTSLSTAILARIDAALHFEDNRPSSVAESSDDMATQKAAAHVILQRAVRALGNATEESSVTILQQLTCIAEATRSRGDYSDDKVYLREEQKATIIALRELNAIARETRDRFSRHEMIPEHEPFMDARLSRRTSIELQKMIHELHASNIEIIASLVRRDASFRHDDTADTSMSDDSAHSIQNHLPIPEPEQQPNGASRREEKKKMTTTDEAVGMRSVSPPTTFISKLVRHRQRPTSDLEAGGAPSTDSARVPLNLHATVVHRAADAVMRRRGTDHLHGLTKFLHYPKSIETEPVDPARVPPQQRIHNNKPLTSFDLPPTAYMPLQNTPFRLVSRQSVMDDPVLRHGVHENAEY
ncbi:hypothetical protein BCR43DRAFT_491677 [Syncephalastrum racemosum]|uniref:Uncharacterized protein n=1 Tax=Syncephalastrum racemosum TaxID=13706 RepID=A0A1X2HCC4_SYNRA|nr:hypothetical protein BCR43DRAFT_491677 [Syncephalastrum racemosum]